ncbi:lipoprotein [Winogradskya consettensis]|uniref:Lipoprotein n=1 Tax=Winogradskya consettensis TaxID=113560 RepID=A0A919SY25_9ACTN|nr:hypothetical protein [Actinoplanes consettensis]GIM79253.1 lipoprotein [Actinoplanes consettensis]
MPALVVAGLAAAVLTGGCTADAICGGGNYPVKLADSATGSTCVPDGQDPPAGYVRYPAGKVPKKVGDKWDVYWQTHKLDKLGKEVY